ncbi:membrane protein insertase YidC [Marinomonas mediterranea]|jgi:protein translocase subunit yidC|uniref:Membrane protein insertase YidC n=1 Tax=Marinomonas mediterranea (strain ATCC 700492 / JCM 21426 / NBRC 103028 / MMB-1) TaxID=717774 RepID=F2K1U1_MARM1|nr:membrane protein insertase YidC [Marinomonas mediterranea]ADZ93425.1 Membrane protein oxaA [Marinomonas mediterranea MMB-1]WCN15377.1 membrane protein insertase YidC [Marinomonas mediterranea]WCN19417.1 membrane protein insertase YidC [Marinomonas mediterranea MMB-1]
MDFRRYFLWGALFVSGYLLFLQWNQDYGPQSQTSQPVAQNQTTVNTATNAESDLPNSVSNTTLPASDTDVPANAKALASGQLIDVKTDTLDISIDPVGGDLVGASLLQYKKTLDASDPFVILENNTTRTYVSQSGLIGQDGIDNSKGRPTYHADKTQYVLADGENTLDVNLYFTDEKGVEYTKTYRFTRGVYSVEQSITVNNTSADDWRGKQFAQIKRDSTEDPSTATSLGLQPYLGGAISTDEVRYEKVSFSDMEEKPAKITTNSGWIALLQHYFVSAWIPKQGETVTLQTRSNNGINFIGFTGPEVEVPAGQKGTLSATFYVGPKLQDQLAATAANLDKTVDYGMLWWLAEPLFWLLTAIQSVVINWGVAIILIVVCVKAVFFKLSAASYRSMAKMRKFGPELTRLREQYGDDRQKMSQAMMTLYKKEKINPLGGCLPILVQMPVFLSLYWVLMESVELRHAPFMLWINDLSYMDPYYVLPILMGLSMLGQQMLNPTPPDPMQARIMKIMPIAFTFFFLWFPSGLVLYWVVNNTLSIIQQYVITKRIEAGK